jgi:hypothetical protein
VHILLEDAEMGKLAHLKLRKSDRDVLADINQVLKAPHEIQELLAAEKTPTLPSAIEAFEALAEIFEALIAEVPALQDAIRAAIAKLRKYIKLARKTRYYCYATGTKLVSMTFSMLLITMYSAQSDTQAGVPGENMGCNRCRKGTRRAF